MSYLVALPDGTNAEFPDEVSHDEAADIISKQFAPQAGMLESGLAGVATGLAGLPLGIAHAGAKLTGIDDPYIQQKRKELEAWGKEHGTESFAGKVGTTVGGVLPYALAAPFTGGMSLAAELGLNAVTMGVPGAVDAYEAAKASGAGSAEAYEKAAAAGAMGTVAPKIVSGGSQAVGAALKAGEGALGKMGLAAGEGAVFSGAGTAGNKAIEVANDRQLNTPWLSPEDMAASALGFGAVRGVHHVMEGPKQAATAKAKSEQEAALVAEEEARLAQKNVADEADTQKQTMDMGPLQGSAIPRAEGVPTQRDLFHTAEDLSGAKPTGPTPTEQERKGYGVEGRAADMEAALAAKDAEDSRALAPESTERTRMELTQQISTMPQVIEQHRAAWAKAQNTAGEQVAAAKFAEAQKQLETAQAALDALPAAPDMDKLNKSLVKAIAAYGTAKEQGDVTAGEKAKARIADLQARGATQAMPMADTWGSEHPDSFNQRVVGPEMAAGRETAAAQRQQVEAEQAALQRMGQAPAVGEAAPMRAQKLAQEQAAALLAAQSAPAGGMPPAQGESQLRALVHRGVGTEGRTLEDVQRDFDLAKSRRDKPAMRAAWEEKQDMLDRQAKEGLESPEGYITSQWRGDQPPDVAAHQDALIARRQGLTQLLMAKPAAREAATGNLRARIVTEIETARGTQTTKAERQQLAALVDPIIARLLAAKKPTMTDARQAQAELDAIRNKFTVKNVYAPPAEPMGPRESRGTELLREQAAGTPNADLLALAPRKTFAPEKAPAAAEEPIVAKDTPRVATLKAEQRRIAEQLAAHDALIGKSGMTAAEERALSAGDIATTKGYPAGDVAAAIARNATERMDLQGRIDALQGRDKAATTPAEKEDIQESLQQAKTDLTLLEVSQRALLERTRALRRQGTMPEETPGLRTPAELKALHTRKQAIQEQLAAIEAAKTAQEQAAQTARRIAAGKETIAAREAATEKDVAAAKQQAGREELAALPGMSVTHEAAEKAARLIETGPDRIARLRAKIADPSATKTTRANDKNELKVLLRTLQLAHDVAAGKKGAMDAIEARIVDISDKIAAYQEQIDAGQPRKYRMDTIADLKRERAALRKSEKGTFNPPTKTPISGMEARREAAADRKAKLFLEKALALEQMGTTGKLKHGDISQASRKEVIAGEQKTGSPESMAGENKTGTRNPIQEERKVTETNRAVGKPEQREANVIAAEIATTVPDAAQEAAKHAEQIKQAEESKAKKAVAETAGTAQQTLRRTRIKLEGFDARIEAAEKRYLDSKTDTSMSAEDKELREKRVADLKEEQQDTKAAYEALVAQHGEAKQAEAPERLTAAEKEAARVTKAEEESAAVLKATEGMEETQPPEVTVKETKTPKRAKQSRAIESSTLEGTEFTHEKTGKSWLYDDFAGEGEASTYAKAHEEAGAIPLSKEASEHIINNDTHAFLNELAKNGSTPEVRALAEKLKGLVGDTSIKLTRNLTDKGESVAGLYTHSENKVEIHPKGFTEETALHELVHAATMQVLERPAAERTAEQNAAVKQLQAMYEAIAKHPNFEGEYGKKDLKEFVAETLSNKAFRDKLDAIGKPQTMLQRILATVKRILGFGGDSESKKASAAIDAILEKSGTGLAEPAAKASPLKNSFVDRDTSWDRTKKSAKGQWGLAAEQAIADHRASLRKILEQYGRPGKYAAWALDQADHLVNIIHDSMVKGAYGKAKDDRGEWVLTPGHGPKYENFSDAVSKANLGSDRANMDGFHSYLMGLHAEQVGWHKLHLENPVGMRREWQENMRYIDAHPEVKTAFENANKILQKMNSAQVDLVEQTHSLPPEVIADMRKLTNYVPMYRVNGDSLEMLGLTSGPKVIGDIRNQPWLYELAGGTDKLMPLESAILRNTSILTGMAMRNHAMTEVAYHLQGIGKDAGPINPKTGKPTGVMQIRRGDGSGSADVLRFRQKPDPALPNDKGERYIKIDTKGTIAEHIPTELVVRAAAGIHQINSPFLKAASFVNGLLRSGVTRMPSYVFSQTLKDAMNASMLGSVKSNPVTAALKSATQLVKGYTGTSAEQHMMEKYGSATSSNVMTDAHDLHKVMLQMAAGSKGNTAWSKAKAMMDTTAMAAEGATRAQILQDVKRSGGSDIEAVYKAARSMDFGAKGADPVVRVIGQLVPFSHSGVTGINNFVHALKGDMPASELLNSKQALYRRGIGLAMGAFAYAMLMENDPKWKEMGLRDKLEYLHLPLGTFNGETVKLGIPFQPGVLFYSLPITMAEMWKRKFSKEDYKTIAEVFGSEFLPMGGNFEAQLTKGVSAIAANYDRSTGQPIESAASQRLTPEQRFGNNTSEISKAVSKRLVAAGLRLSPAQLDYLTNSYFGQLPLSIAKMADGVIQEQVKGVERPTKHLSEGPMGRFFQKATGSDAIDHVYEMEDRAKEAEASYNKLAKTGRAGEIKEFVQSHRLDLMIAKTAPAFTSAMSKLSEVEQVTRNRPGMGADTKQQKIDRIREQKAAIASRFYEALDRIKERHANAAGT